MNAEVAAKSSFSDHESLWAESLNVIRDNVNARSFQTWFTPLKAIGMFDHTLRLEVPSKFFSEWLENHYMKLIKDAVAQIAGNQVKIVFDVQQNQPYSPYTESMIQKPVELEERAGRHNSNLNANYTFDNFIIGDSNRFAAAAAQAVADAPGSTAYNPLIIYGGTGLGKTHLIQAIGNHVLSKSPEKKVYYASSEQFTSHFINSIQQNKIYDFSQFYRSIDVLLIDDIHFFSNKGKTQEEFFHIFNQLHQQKKQIVLTSDRPINELSFLEERLVSRFKWGLVADIQIPDLETRTAILQKKCEENGLSIDNEIVDFLAMNLESNVRELEGALTRMMAMVLLTHTEPTIELAKNVVTEIGKPTGKSLSIDQIIQVTAKSFGVPEEAFRKKNRKKEIAFARQVAMYLAKELTEFSLTVIGLHFGGRDHATVLYAHKVIENQMRKDDALAERIEKMKKLMQHSR